MHVWGAVDFRIYLAKKNHGYSIYAQSHDFCPRLIKLDILDFTLSHSWNCPKYPPDNGILHHRCVWYIIEILCSGEHAPRLFCGRLLFLKVSTCPQPSAILGINSYVLGHIETFPSSCLFSNKTIPPFIFQK